MLDLGFIHALKRIVALVPPKRQTLFFSATMPRAIKELADKYLTNPAEVSVTPHGDHRRPDRAERDHGQPGRKDRAAGAAPAGRARSSARWCSAAPSMAPTRSCSMLAAAGIPAGAIHGNKSQAQRERALAAFKSGEARVLIATDIAARGIDIPGVSHVINFDLPDVPEQYVHRIGRTARAGADGIAIAFCAPDERGNLRDIERTTRQQIAVAAAAGGLHGQRPKRSSGSSRRRSAERRSASSARRPRPTAGTTASGATTATTASSAIRSAPTAIRPSFGAAGPQRPAPRRAFAAARRCRISAAAGWPAVIPARSLPRGTSDRAGEPSPMAASARAQPSEARGGYRPNGGQPKRSFHGRRGRPGGPRRAHG